MLCATDDPEHGRICDRSSSCTVNVLWVRVRDAISGALESMTLADLVARAAPVASTASDEPCCRTVTDREHHRCRHGRLVIRGLRVAPIAKPEHEILQGIDLESAR